MKILLDTNVVLAEPKILAKKKKGVNLVIPQSILLELTTASIRMPKGEPLSGIVDSAIEAGKVEVFRPDRQLRTPIPSERLSGVDIDLLNSAKEIQQQEQNVAIATNDREILMAAKQIGIQTYNLHELRSFFKENVQIDQKIGERANTWLSVQYRHLLSGIIIGVTANVLANLIWTYFDRIVSTVSIWGTIVGILIIGLGIYTVRGRYRLPYGVFELLFGSIAAIRVFYPDFNYEDIKAPDILQIIGGLYIMVRGQDNIGKALRKTTRFKPFWDKFSGERD